MGLETKSPAHRLISMGLCLTLGGLVGGGLRDLAHDNTLEAPVPTALDELSQRLGNIAGLASPVIVEWNNCPPGSPGRPKVRVRSFFDPDDSLSFVSDKGTGTYMEIEDITYYWAPGGSLAAWCGRSTGSDSGNNVNPARGTVIVVPYRPDEGGAIEYEPLPAGSMMLPN